MEMGKVIFKCSKCGECCRRISDENSSSKGLPIFEWEVEQIKKLANLNNIKINIEPIDLVLDKKSGKYFCTGYVLTQEPCVFLKDNKCLIHKDRPIVCRAFPVAKNPEFMDEVPNLGCFSNCPNFDFKAFLSESLGLKESQPFNLTSEKILAEYSETFDGEIMKNSFIRDSALNYFDELMKTLTKENLIDIEVVEKKNNITPAPFLQFLVERKFLSEEDKIKIIEEFVI